MDWKLLFVAVSCVSLEQTHVIYLPTRYYLVSWPPLVSRFDIRFGIPIGYNDTVVYIISLFFSIMSALWFCFEHLTESYISLSYRWGEMKFIQVKYLVNKNFMNTLARFFWWKWDKTRYYYIANQPTDLEFLLFYTILFALQYTYCLIVTEIYDSRWRGSSRSHLSASGRNTYHCYT